MSKYKIEKLIMSLSVMRIIFTCLYTKLSHITFYPYHYIHYCEFNVPRRFDDNTQQLHSYNLAKKIYPRYCPLHTTYVKRTLCVVFLVFYGVGSFHRQTAGRYVLHYLPDSKDFCRRYAKGDSMNGNYYLQMNQS